MREIELHAKEERIEAEKRSLRAQSDALREQSNLMQGDLNQRAAAIYQAGGRAAGNGSLITIYGHVSLDSPPRLPMGGPTGGLSWRLC